MRDRLREIAQAREAEEALANAGRKPPRPRLKIKPLWIALFLLGDVVVAAGVWIALNQHGHAAVAQPPPRILTAAEVMAAADANARRDGVTITHLPAGANIPARPYPDAFDVQFDGPNPYPEMSAPDESERQLRKRISKEAETLFVAGDFTKLDALGEHYRTTDPRTPAGAFKLDLFYEPFANCHCDHPGENLTTQWLKIAARYRKAYPKSQTALMIQAQLIEDDAWRLRGGGYAYKTSREQFAAFHARADDVFAVLRANLKLTYSDPTIFVLLPRLAKASGEIGDPKSMTNVLNEIANRAPDYTPAWFAAIDDMSPEWNDSPELAGRMAEVAAEATKDELGDEMYARLIHHAWAVFDDRIFSEGKVDRARLRRGAADLLARYPDKHNFMAYGHMACHLKDWEMAEPLIARMQVLSAESFADFPDYAACRRDIYYRHH